MTVFVASLFLPKTIHFNLPGADSRPDRFRRHKSRPPKLPKTPSVDLPAPSLFTPLPANLTPPDTPPNEIRQLFSNEDGFRVPVSNPLITTAIDEDELEWSQWGTLPNQPMARTTTPPLAELSEKDRMAQKARELGRQGITQPRKVARSDSHDRVFSSADWKAVDADQGNGRLRNATMAAAREGGLDDYSWVGTLGMPTDALAQDKKNEIADSLATEHDMQAVFCLDKDFDGHYSHFCKQILWPVFHYQIPDNPKSKAYEDHSWKYYVSVNQAFADKIVKNWKRGDVIWVHDYHLLLVPGMVRQKLPDAKIGLFLHLAFPSSEVFRCLAMRKELLEGMLGANLIGFQIQEYSRHFLQTCSRIINAEATPEGLQLENRFVNVMSLPIGIDPVALQKHRGEEEVAKWIQVLKERYRGKKLIVARDKLDHLRGVRQKLLSYELFLNKNPQWRGNIVLIQVALSTNERSDLDATVSDIVTRVNSSWANLAYQPVVYLKQDIDYAQYLALLTVADALMITSQREGMNMTSHEYIACQDGQFFSESKHGSLILSEFTGSAYIFGNNELSVNPWDYRQCSDAIQQALEMSESEKKQRWGKLNEIVGHHTGAKWFTEFLQRLEVVCEEQTRKGQTSVPRLSFNQLSQKYKDANKRLLLLDFEGTLINWGQMDQVVAVSLQRTVDILGELLWDERNIVYVMSGRPPEELGRLFHQIPHLGLIAENGCFLREYGAKTWLRMADEEQMQQWKQQVKPIISYYLDRTPGASLEERRCSLVFDYSGADDAESAARLASDCSNHVNDESEQQRVHAITTDGAVVVEPLDWNKSTAAERIFVDLKGKVDFLMVVGDNREDEQVFKWANGLGTEKVVERVCTVSLGTRNTEAMATMPQGVSGVLNTMQKLSML